MPLCPCCSSLEFEQCCSAYLKGLPAPNPEKLMRSRYTAYTLCDSVYILRTTHSSMRKYYSAKSNEQWSKESLWLSLEIEEVAGNTVIFKAYYNDLSGQLHVHHERSVFKKENGIWYFLEGTVAD